MHATESRCRCGVPTLYYDELSPQSRSCYMLIKLLDIEVELQKINMINGEHLTDSFRKINPPGAIPTLIDGQFILSDGHTIMMYLCDKYAGVYLPHLCPRDYLPRLNVLNMLFYDGCVLYRRYSHLLTEILLKKYPNMDMSYHQAKIIDSYNTLDTNLKGQSCVTGNCLTIADLSIITTLSGLDLMFPISPDQWPNLHRWFENLKNMDCYKCNDEGIQKLSNLLETEGQFPLPSSLTLEATAALRSSLQPSVDIDKDKLNSTKWDESNALRENEETTDNDRNSHSSNSASSEDETGTKLPKFLPKVRTSKIIISPSHTDHEAESSPELEKLYEKPADEELRDSEMESGVEDCQPERNTQYKASECICCCRSSILKRSQMDWTCWDCIQKNQSANCNHHENNNRRMTEPIKCSCCVEPKLKDSIVITCSAKNHVNPQYINKVKCVEFECQVKNKDQTQQYPDNYNQCPCCSDCWQNAICANVCACAFDEGELREFRSCICIENCDSCDPLCPCALKMIEKQREANEMKTPCPSECEYSDYETDDVTNQECEIDCNCQEDINDEDCECYEDDDDNEPEDMEDNCVCCCVDEDANANRFQEEFCCCDEDKEEEICCCYQNPLEVDKMRDNLICCCDEEQQICNDTSDDVECCCEGDTSNPTSSDNTSHITICLCDGRQAKHLDICCDNNGEAIENSSNENISCCCQETDITSNDDNCSCENEYQDIESFDDCEVITDDGHTAASQGEEYKLGSSNASNVTLISCNNEEYQRGNKCGQALNCCCAIRDSSCLVCSCCAEENGKGFSEEQSVAQSCPKIKPSTYTFRHEPIQNRFGKCCCRPDVKCHYRMECTNKTLPIQGDSNQIGHCGKASELHPNLRANNSNKPANRYCMCSKSVEPTSPPRYVCTCGGSQLLSNRESVIQKKTTQCEDSKGTPRKCSCSAGIVDTRNWKISQPRIEETDGLHQHETLEQERRTFGSLKATQQKSSTKNIHQADADKVKAVGKTLSDRSPGKSFDKLESMGYKGTRRTLDSRTKANTFPVSGTRKGSLAEVQNNSRITTTDTGKPQTSYNRAPLNEKKSSAPRETSEGQQRKDVGNDPRTVKDIETIKDLPQISDNLKDSKSYGPKTKIENSDKTKKGNTESIVDAKIKEDEKKYESVSNNKKSKIGDKTNDENRNASKGGKSAALGSEPGNTDPSFGGKDLKSVHKTKGNVTGTTDKDSVKQTASKVADEPNIGQASKTVAGATEIEGHGRANKESKYDNKTRNDVETGPADKQLEKQASIKTADQQKVKSLAPKPLRIGTEKKVAGSEDKESRNENNTKETTETGSANKQQQVKEPAAKSVSEQRPSQAYRTKETADRASKQKVKQLTAKSTNERRASQTSSDKRGSKTITEKGKLPDQDNEGKSNDISKMSAALEAPINLVRLKCSKCSNNPSTSSAVCVTVPNSQEQDNCLKCQAQCTCVLAGESAPTITCPVLDCKIEQCPHQISQHHCEDQSPCGKPARWEWKESDCESCSTCEQISKQREKFKHDEQYTCESARAQKTKCQSQPASCSKGKSTCSTSFQVKNCVSDQPCVGLHPIQHDTCGNSTAIPANCCPSGNKGNKIRATNGKKIVCTPKKATRKSKRLSAGSSQSKSQLSEYCSCDNESNHAVKQTTPSLREKNELRQSFFAQDLQDSTSNISQEEITSIRHFYNWDDLKGEQPKASESKGRDIKRSKIPRLILPKVYLVYRESHDTSMKPSQKCKEFSKLPGLKLYGGQDNRKGNQEKPLRYTYQEPKCSPEIIKKCCRSNPSRIPQLDQNGLSTTSRSGTNRTAKEARASITCNICEKYLQAKSASSQYAESVPDKSLSGKSLKTLQPKPSNSRSKNRETICITKVECCNSNGCLIKKVSRVTTTSIRRESPSYVQNLGNSLSSLSSAGNTPLEAVNKSREEENIPIATERENKQLRECKCCHCREQQTESREIDAERYERDGRRHINAETPGNEFIISEKPGRYQNEPASQDHQSLRANVKQNTERRTYKKERQSMQEQRPEYQKQSDQVHNKRSDIGPVLGQEKHSRVSQDNGNNPQDAGVYKPRELYCYPSSHRDGAQYKPKPDFVLHQKTYSPNRIRGGLTDQLGKESKSDTFVRIYGCSCKKSGEMTKCMRKRTNRDLPNGNEYCTCDLTVTKDKSSVQAEQRPSAYSESRLSKLINGPRRTITHPPATSNIPQYKKSAIPKTLVPSTVETDTFLRIYGCPCKKSTETKISDKCKGKRTILTSNKDHLKENGYCRCDSTVDKDNDKFVPKEHNPNPVILNVSIQTCSEDKANDRCKCCREKEIALCDGMVELSCTCCCGGENERLKMNENDLCEEKDEQIIGAGAKEGSLSQDENSQKSNKNITAPNGQSPKEDSRNMKLGRKDSKFVPTKQDASVMHTTKSNKEAPNTMNDRRSNIQNGDASQEEDSPESNKILYSTARNGQSPKEDSRNMKLGRKESKFVPTKQNAPAADTAKSNKETPKTTKKRESTIQRGEAMDRKGKEMKTKSISDPDPEHPSHVNVFSETRDDISRLEHQEQIENRGYTTSAKEMTLQVFRCMCGRTIPCPYRQKTCPLECVEISAGECCRSQKSENEDDQSKVKNDIEPLDNNNGESPTTLESINEPIQKEGSNQTDSKGKGATKSSIPKKDNPKSVNKLNKIPTKPNGKEVKENLNAVGGKPKESTETNGKGKKEDLPAPNANKNAKRNSLQNSTTRYSNAIKPKAKIDIAGKNNRTKPVRSSKDETIKHTSNLTGTQSENQESSKTSEESVTKEPSATKPTAMPENCSPEPTKEDEQRKSHSKPEETPENLCDISDESFMKDFDEVDTNIPGSCDVMVVTKRTHFLKRNGAEKIEEKRLVITKPSDTNLGNCSHVGIPQPDSEVIKKCKRIGDKVCTITITKGNKVKKRSGESSSDKD